MSTWNWNIHCFILEQIIIIGDLTSILTSWERNGMICAQIAFNLFAISVWKKYKKFIHIVCMIKKNKQYIKITCIMDTLSDNDKFKNLEITWRQCRKMKNCQKTETFFIQSCLYFPHSSSTVNHVLKYWKYNRNHNMYCCGRVICFSHQSKLSSCIKLAHSSGLSR